jgi:protein-tyrosine phosphatase
MAAAFLTRALDRGEIPAQVVSAGTRARPGSSVPPEVLETMRGFGIELSEHESRELTPQLAQGAHVVLGLTRDHLREAVMMDPRLLDTGFTVKELARRAGAQGFRPVTDPLEPWLATLVANRDVMDLMGADPLDDVSDPIGGPLVGYQDTAAELSQLVDRIVRTVWPA